MTTNFVQFFFRIVDQQGPRYEGSDLLGEVLDVASDGDNDSMMRLCAVAVFYHLHGAQITVRLPNCNASDMDPDKLAEIAAALILDGISRHWPRWRQPEPQIPISNSLLLRYALVVLNDSRDSYRNLLFRSLHPGRIAPSNEHEVRAQSLVSAIVLMPRGTKHTELEGRARTESDNALEVFPEALEVLAPHTATRELVAVARAQELLHGDALSRASEFLGGA